VRFRFLLRPGWLVLTLVVLSFAASCFTLLAPWQFRRNTEREAQNAAVLASTRTDPVPLDEVLPQRVEPSGAQEWRQVKLTGRYRPEAEALARLRTVQGEPAYEVLTPFRLVSTGADGAARDGDTVLVDRGYVRLAAGKAMPYPAPPTGQVTVVARVRPDEPVNRDVLQQDGHRQVYSVNAEVVGRASGLDLRPGYFQLVANQPGVTEDLPLPQLDSGPFLSYALQWIAFGVMALLGLVYFTVREAQPGGALSEQPRARRRTVAELLAEDETTEAGGPSEADATAAAEADATRSASSR
jgi:cytochrome oxidase assembly protein ShyY1